jgi:hypothetical protein
MLPALKMSMGTLSVQVKHLEELKSNMHQGLRVTSRIQTGFK